MIRRTPVLELPQALTSPAAAPVSFEKFVQFVNCSMQSFLQMQFQA